MTSDAFHSVRSPFIHCQSSHMTDYVYKLHFQIEFVLYSTHHTHYVCMDYLISYTKLIMYAWISQFLTQSSLRMHGLANFVHKAHYVCKIYFSIHV